MSVDHSEQFCDIDLLESIGPKKKANKTSSVDAVAQSNTIVSGSASQSASSLSSNKTKKLSYPRNFFGEAGKGPKDTRRSSDEMGF